jgi:hypothetical protein
MSARLVRASSRHPGQALSPRRVDVSADATVGLGAGRTPAAGLVLAVGPRGVRRVSGAARSRSSGRCSCVLRGGLRVGVGGLGDSAMAGWAAGLLVASGVLVGVCLRCGPRRSPAETPRASMVCIRLKIPPSPSPPAQWSQTTNHGCSSPIPIVCAGLRTTRTRPLTTPPQPPPARSPVTPGVGVRRAGLGLAHRRCMHHAPHSCPIGVASIGSQRIPSRSCLMRPGNARASRSPRHGTMSA